MNAIPAPHDGLEAGLDDADPSPAVSHKNATRVRSLVPDGVRVVVGRWVEPAAYVYAVKTRAGNVELAAFHEYDDEPRRSVLGSHMRFSAMEARHIASVLIAAADAVDAMEKKP